MHERCDPLGILDAPGSLDSAGDIHRPRPDASDRIRHVLRIQSPGQNQRQAKPRRDQGPVERLAGTAVGTLHECVKEQGFGLRKAGCVLYQIEPRPEWIQK